MEQQKNFAFNRMSGISRSALKEYSISDQDIVIPSLGTGYGESEIICSVIHDLNPVLIASEKVLLSDDPFILNRHIDSLTASCLQLNSLSDYGRDEVLTYLSFMMVHMLSRLRQRKSVTLKTSPMIILGTLKELRSESEIRSYLNHFYCSCCAESRESSPVSHILIRKVLTLIEREIEGEISLGALAEALEVTPSYLSHLFKKDLGENFVSYVRKKKIEYAIELLRNTNLRVYEIAHRLSYRDLNYFNRIFKIVTGVTPTEYRDLTVAC